jgi:hypothetical protein
MSEGNLVTPILLRYMNWAEAGKAEGSKQPTDQQHQRDLGFTNTKYPLTPSPEMSWEQVTPL